MRFSSKLRLGLAAGAAMSVCTAGVVYYNNPALVDSSWLSSLRAVRFGRAAYAVSCDEIIEVFSNCL
jgi:hypothetical protein